MRRITFNPTKIFDDVGTFLSFQVRDDDGTPFTSVAGMPIDEVAAFERHSFVGWINLVQSAECEAVSGYATSVSNVAFDFNPFSASRSRYLAHARAAAVVTNFTRRARVVDNLYNSFAAHVHFANLNARFQRQPLPSMSCS